MAARTKISVSLQKTLLDQAETLAQALKISRSHLCEIAIENFVSDYQSQSLPNEGRTEINQGDIYWVQLDEPGIRHPHVIVQDNVLNYSRITSVVACALTSNITRANMPGNVLLDVAEANLPRQSVVEVSKVSTIDKSQLGDYIGSLTEQRIHQILAGMRFLQRSASSRPDALVELDK